MLLDTNAYSGLAQNMPAVVEAVSNASGLKLPLPVIAELRYGFAKGSRTEYNEQTLQRFLAQPQVSIMLPTIRTTEHYAMLQLACQQRGRVLSNNDIWIAAIAYENKETLITFDADFGALADILGDLLVLLEL